MGLVGGRRGRRFLNSISWSYNCRNAHAERHSSGRGGRRANLTCQKASQNITKKSNGGCCHKVPAAVQQLASEKATKYRDGSQILIAQSPIFQLIIPISRDYKMLGLLYPTLSYYNIVLENVEAE